MSRRDLLAWAKEWWGILVLLAGCIGVLTGSKLLTGDARITALEVRADATDAAVDTIRSDLKVLDGMALSDCQKETHPIVRQVLQCGRREAEAGIRR